MSSGGTGAAPLPKRRATEAATDEAEALDDRPRIPRQRPQASAPLDEASLIEEFADNDYREGRFEPSRNGGDRYDDRRDSAYDDDQGRSSEVSAPTTAPPVWPPRADATARRGIVGPRRRTRHRDRCRPARRARST